MFVCTMIIGVPFFRLYLFWSLSTCCTSFKIKIWTKRPFIGQNCLHPSKKDYFQWVKSFRPKSSKFQPLKEHLKCIWQSGPRAFNRNTKGCGCRVFHIPLGRTSFGRQLISLNVWTVKSSRTEKWQFLLCCPYQPRIVVIAWYSTND